MLYRLLFSILVFDLFAYCAAWADKPTYLMDAQEYVNHKTSTSTFTQRVYDRKIGRTVWVRHFPGYGGITWSSDHRAVVFETGMTPAEAPNHHNGTITVIGTMGQQIKVQLYPFRAITLVTWIAGHSVERFSPIPFITDDYTEDFYWSPDKSHLLFRTGSSGASTIDIGELWCVNLKTHKALSIDHSVRKIQWIGSRKVKYWIARYAHGSDGDIGPYISSKPRVWYLPNRF